VFARVRQQQHVGQLLHRCGACADGRGCVCAFIYLYIQFLALKQAIGTQVKIRRARGAKMHLPQNSEIEPNFLLRHTHTTEQNTEMAEPTQAAAETSGVALGKGAWDCDNNCEIPPEKEVCVVCGFFSCVCCWWW
jgi:hypothetical protein